MTTDDHSNLCDKCKTVTESNIDKLRAAFSKEAQRVSVIYLDEEKSA